MIFIKHLFRQLLEFFYIPTRIFLIDIKFLDILYEQKFHI